MTSLQIGLIIGGIVLVVGVMIYNWLQERRVRRRVAAERGAGDRAPSDARRARGNVRVEPTLARAGDGEDRAIPIRDVHVVSSAGQPTGEHWDEEMDGFVAPVDYAPRSAADESNVDDQVAESGTVAAAPAPLRASQHGQQGQHDKMATQPDPDAECVISLQPSRPVTAGELGAGFNARIGKPLRWLGRSGPQAPWQRLRLETPGEFTEIAACLLLADRAGAVTRAMIERFVRMVGEVAATLPATFVPPDPQRAAERAEALDRICADLDVQIGLTVLKPAPGTITGTRLRGVAEAAGFRLSDSGRFDWIQEDTGSVLYSLQNYKSEPFTADSLRITSTPGAVFILDVPRVTDPVRVFDQMKLSAKRMTLTLDAALVDDNKRPLDDAALAAIRQQVQATAAALKEIHVIPGSPRALALFGS